MSRTGVRKGDHLGLQGAGRAVPQELGATGRGEMGVALSVVPRPSVSSRCLYELQILAMLGYVLTSS